MRWLLAIGVLLGGCKSGFSPVPTDPPMPTDTDDTDTDTDVPTPPPTVVPTGETGEPPPPTGPEVLALPTPTDVDNGRFATSGNCVDCHSNHSASTAMRDGAGNPVGPYDLWQASMMANSSRDPIWRAVVSAEIAATPGAAQLIGERCMSCHAPMAATDAALISDTPPNVPTLSSGSDRGMLGLDGVSCTLCHQINPSNFPGEDSWKGNYIVDQTQTLYGPHTNPNGPLMATSGWSPAHGSQMTDPRLCATCHTLITEALNPDGTPTGGSLVEQAPYLEMQNSTSSNSSCQNCHLPPRADDDSGILTRIARAPDGTDYSTIPERTMARHTLVGGNTLGPQLFATWHDVLQPRASVEAFETQESRARTQLQTKTAFLYIQNASRAGSTLQFDTRIEPLTGHKFPTGIPIRRAWLQTTVHDANGQLVFQSGNYDSRGRILDPTGAVRASDLPGGPIEPHHDTITTADQVQIYEAVMADDAGLPTFLLLRGAGFHKDNRVLPNGWSPTYPGVDRIAPQGVEGDMDYINGGDVVSWSIDVGAAPGPFSVEVRLVYQSLSQRFAEQLWLANTPETDALRTMLQSVSTAPDVVALNTQTVP